MDTFFAWLAIKVGVDKCLQMLTQKHDQLDHHNLAVMVFTIHHAEITFVQSMGYDPSKTSESAVETNHKTQMLNN